MTFQAYLTTSRRRRGSLLTRVLLNWRIKKGFDQSTKATPIVQWLADDYGLGRGHAMALVHVITKGPQISATHVGTEGTHSDPNDHLWLDGVATKPDGY